MCRLAPVVLSLCLGCVCPFVFGQTICPTQGEAKLYCLIPTALHTPPNEFNFFNEAFATELSQLPLASPASGIIYSTKGGLPTATNAGFGPIMTERAETIGRHKWYVAFTYQRFGFNSIDGTNLKSVPIVLTFPPTNPTVYTQTYNRIDTTVNQYVGYATFGLTSGVDVSVAVPFERISMAMATFGTEYSTTSSATASFQQYIPGSASGFGDVVLAGKGKIFNGENLRAALGLELRLPSGDAKNFLGSGAVGVKPYIAFSRSGKVSPHLDLGYQWNGKSILARNSLGHDEELPKSFIYVFGADFTPAPWITFVADLVGQHIFNAPRVTPPISVMIPNRNLFFPTVLPTNASYDPDNLSFGLKANPWSNLLVTANLLVRPPGNQGGLRCNIVPMAGLSYTF